MIIKGIKKNLILLIIIFFFISANLIWIMIDQAPPMWDQSHYLLNSEILYHTLTKKGIISFVAAFTNILKTKAPLITVLPIPFYMLFGDNYKSALCVNLAFIILGSYYLYKLGILISGQKEAILSVFILNTFPLIFAMSREFLVEYGLMVFVIMWMYYFIKSDCLDNEKYAYALGIILGLGMLMKITFILYIIFPTLFIFIRKLIELKKMPRSIKNIFVVIFVGTLISGIWYFKNLRFVIDFALTSGYSDIAKNYGLGDVFSLKTIFAYWVNIINTGISAYFFLLIIFLISLKLINFLKDKSIPGFDKTHFYFLIIWFAAPFIVLTIGVNKDYRYTAPLYPALAILMSISLIQLSFKKYGRLLLFILLFFSAANYLFISFSSKPVNLQKKQLILLSNSLAYAHGPVKEKWPNKSLVKFIYRDASRTNNNYALTTLLFDHEYMNHITSNYYSKNIDSDVRFKTNDYFSKESVDEIAAGIEQDSDYLVTKSDKVGPNFSNAKNIPIISLLNEGKLNFRKVATIPLPDDTFLTIYKKEIIDNIVYSDTEKLKDYQINTKNSINFSDKIRLSDYKITRIKDGYKFIFFWECLDAIDLNYKIIVHVKDLYNSTVLYADHYPHKNQYPTFQWNKGEIVRDEINIKAALPQNFHVYVGLYEESLGFRLPAKNESLDVTNTINEVRIY